MTLKIITQPATEPITLAEAKLHLKVEHTVDDALITALITAARRQAEHIVGRPFITQTWEQALDAFPPAEIDLGKPNVLAILSVTYVDTSGVEQTLSSSDYSLDAQGIPCWLLPAIDTEWPDTLDTANAVRVRFTCGYGDAASVPEEIKLWMKLHIGNHYANRESMVDNRLMLMPQFDSLLDAERVWLM